VDNYYELHNHSIRVESHDQMLAGAAGDILQYLRAMPARSLGLQADLSMTLGRANGAQVIPDGAEVLGEHERGVVVLQTKNRVFLWYESTIVELRPERGTAAFYFETLDGTIPRGLLFDLIVLSLLILLRPRGHYLLHAACVLHDGAGYLISASSNSGKSSLALSLVREGWPYLSDDMLLLHEEGGEVFAKALGRHFRLAPEAVQRFPEVAEAVPGQGSLVDKLHIDVDAIYPGLFTASCLPRLPDLRQYPRYVIQSALRLGESTHRKRHLADHGERPRQFVRPSSRLVQLPQRRSLPSRDYNRDPRHERPLGHDLQHRIHRDRFRAESD
jgi:hypothetical protein